MSWNLTMRKYAYKNCQKLVSTIVEEKEEPVVWVLDDWEENWEVLSKRSTCTIEIGNVSLIFSLSESVKSGKEKEGTWLSLLVQPQYTCSVGDAAKMELTMKCHVDELMETYDGKRRCLGLLGCLPMSSGKGLGIAEELLPAAYFTINGTSKVTLKEKFIDISNTNQDERLLFGIICSVVNFKSEVLKRL